MTGGGGWSLSQAWPPRTCLRGHGIGSHLGPAPHSLPLKPSQPWAGEVSMFPKDTVCVDSYSPEPLAFACLLNPLSESPEPRPRSEGGEPLRGPHSAMFPRGRTLGSQAAKQAGSWQAPAQIGNQIPSSPPGTLREHAPFAKLISMSLSPEFTQLKLGWKGRHFFGSSSTPKGSAQLGRIGKH